MCLAQGPQRCDAGEARTRGPLVSSKHYTTEPLRSLCLAVDPWVPRSIPARSHTFVEIDYGIITTAILFSSTDSRRVVVRNKRFEDHEILVNRLDCQLLINPEGEFCTL